MEEIENRRKITNKAGITLVALVVTIVVLLILAGITLTYVLGDNSVFKQASEAKLKTDITNWQERLEMAKSPVFIEGLGTFDPDKYFDYIQEQGIINNKDTDVINNEDGTYDVTTKPEYVFLVTLMPNPEKPTDAEIEYIGQNGKIAPKINKVQTSATPNSIIAKAIVSRLGNGTVTYYYKLSSADDSKYEEISNITGNGATVEGLPVGETYMVKVVANNDIGEDVKIVEITTTKIMVESIKLNKEDATIVKGKTDILEAIIKPDNATNKNVIWASDNEKIATISDTGVILGKAEGTVTINVSATDGSNKTASCVVVVKEPTVADIVGETQTTNTPIKDKNGNKIVIPEGFKVIPDTDENDVDYPYSGDKTPSVQDGIVIADEEGNQFVWIPVGDIQNKDGTTTNITLGRYTFASDGTPTLGQNAENFLEIVSVGGAEKEVANSSAVPYARDLAGYIASVSANGGYYLGRIEASKGEDGKAKENFNSPWDDVGVRQASPAARNAYTSLSFFSDLPNSYSWDTALRFLQEFCGNYKFPVTLSKNTGYNYGRCDKACNIYNMAGNYMELTTEVYSSSSKAKFHWIARGGVKRDASGRIGRR